MITGTILVDSNVAVALGLLLGSIAAGGAGILGAAAAVSARHVGRRRPPRVVARPPGPCRARLSA